MAITFSFLQSATDTADLSEYTFSSQSLGAADSDRYIIVGAIARKAGAATSVSSVTIGGVTSTELLDISNSDSNSNNAGLFIANVPTGTTGDVVVTYGATMVRCAIGMWRILGIEDGTPYDSDSSTASDPSVSLDIPADGATVGMAISNSATTATWTGITEDFDGTLESFVTYTGASDSDMSEETGRTLTADFASSGSTPIGVFASWAPEGAGGVNLMQLMGVGT